MLGLDHHIISVLIPFFLSDQHFIGSNILRQVYDVNNETNSEGDSNESLQGESYDKKSVETDPTTWLYKEMVWHF